MIDDNITYPFEKIRWIKHNTDYYVGRCPFCGDSVKHLNAGHFYVAKHYPSFHCFRCGTKGHISKLEKFLNESSKVDYSSFISFKLPKINITDIFNYIDDLIEESCETFNKQELTYFMKRCRLNTITYKEIKKFGLLSQTVAKRYINSYNTNIMNSSRTWTIRGFGTALSGRSHNKEDIRYYNQNIDLIPWKEYINTDCYFIKDEQLFNYYPNYIPNNLIIAEGVYDIVPLYLNSNKYMINTNNSIFMAAQCSSYERTLKVYNMLYGCNPKSIQIFADKGITLDTLSKQFESVKSDINIIINWPTVKDWEDTHIVRTSIKL